MNDRKRQMFPLKMGFLIAMLAGAVQATSPGQYRLTLRPEQVAATPEGADFSALAD